MTTVFISGSRKIGRLNAEIRDRLREMTERSDAVVVGDANGADRAVQKYLDELGYPRVTVYCSGSSCRNNVGSWPTRNVAVSPKLRGRAFYTKKDKAMADDADCGFVLWNGDSAGAIENIIELLKRGKTASVYLSLNGAFYLITSVSELRSMLSECTPDAIDDIDRKIGLNRALDKLGRKTQMEFTF
jgi:hypothetical protein